MSRKKWSSGKIFTRLLTNKSRKTYWSNISELRSRPTESTYKQAYALASSHIDKEKIIGLDVLQQLGYDPRFNQKETIELHFKLLNEYQSNSVLISIFYGIGHNNENLSAKQISKLTEYKHIKNTDVKYSLISALSGIENSKTINVLIEFMEDKAALIRNWSTFGIGTLTDISNPNVINALWNRVLDTDFETKSEAIFGLARRKDKQIKEVIISELNQGNYGSLLFQAIIAMPDKDFISPLNQCLETVREDTDDIVNGWQEVIEDTIEELEQMY